MVLGVHIVADGSVNSALNAITEEFTSETGWCRITGAYSKYYFEECSSVYF